MYVVVLCIASGLVGTCAADARPHYDIEKAEELFEDFVTAYGKIYADHEKQNRLNIFRENLKRINQKNSAGGAIFAVNKFADLTREEFRVKHTGFKPNPLGAAKSVCQLITDADVKTNDAPASKNWVDEGAVTPAKNQKKCGSCWTFATIGSIEGQSAIVNKKLTSLSEQEVIDCSTSSGNNGCGGGDMVTAFNDLISLGGVESEASYPYKESSGKCQFDVSKAVVQLKGCTNYRMKDEAKFKEVLAKKGPIAIGIDSDGLDGYHGGVLNRTECIGDSVHHAVLLVGYGTEKGVDYWLVKNSWGVEWGEKGFFRITRGENTCGLMSSDSNAAPNL